MGSIHINIICNFLIQRVVFCQQDTARGKAYLEKSKDSPYKNYGLGMMYAEGLGVREDIEQGMVYLKRAAWANYEPAKEAMTHYKKSWFGVWRRK